MYVHVHYMYTECSIIFLFTDVNRTTYWWELVCCTCAVHVQYMCCTCAVHVPVDYTMSMFSSLRLGPGCDQWLLWCEDHEHDHFMEERAGFLCHYSPLQTWSAVSWHHLGVHRCTRCACTCKLCCTCTCMYYSIHVHVHVCCTCTLYTTDTDFLYLGIPISRVIFLQSLQYSRMSVHF